MRLLLILCVLGRRHLHGAGDIDSLWVCSEPLSKNCSKNSLQVFCAQKYLPLVPKDPAFPGPLSPAGASGARVFKELKDPPARSRFSAAQPPPPSPSHWVPLLQTPALRSVHPRPRASLVWPRSLCQARAAKQSPHSEPRGENSKQVEQATSM